MDSLTCFKTGPLLMQVHTSHSQLVRCWPIGDPNGPPVTACRACGVYGTAKVIKLRKACVPLSAHTTASHGRQWRMNRLFAQRRHPESDMLLGRPVPIFIRTADAANPIAAGGGRSDDGGAGGASEDRFGTEVDWGPFDGGPEVTEVTEADEDMARLWWDG